MNKMTMYALALVASLLGFASCGNDNSETETPSNVSFTLSQTKIDVSPLGGSFTVDVSTNAKEWSAYSSDTKVATVTANGTASPKGNVVITVSKNTTSVDRSTTVYVKSGQNREGITITQFAPLSVSSSSVFFTVDGGTENIEVKTGYEWTFSSADSWISCKKNASILSITTEANAGEYRTGKVTVTAGDETLDIEVKQDAKSEFNCPLPGYHLVWNDEFSEGNTLNNKQWSHEVKGAGWVNNELQTYVNGTSPKGARVTELVDGKLQIHCFKEDGKIYSGRVYGNKSKGWQYGYVEASIKLPSGKGTWPAFWMMPVNYTAWPDDGEIDIMEEVGYNRDYVSSSLHALGHVHTNGTQVTYETKCAGAEGEFHTYAMEWTPDYFQFYVDGKKTLYYKNPGTGKRDWPYDAPFYVIFNLAWGGNWGGSQGVNESALPVTMEVDYVRVYQK